MLNTISFRAMGTTVNIWLEGDHHVVKILEQMPKWFDTVENHLSRFRAHSELSQLNRRAGESVNASPWLLDGVLAARYAAEETNGLFNPLTLPALIHAGYDRSFDRLNVENSSFYGTAPPPIANWEDIDVNLSNQTVYLPPETAIDFGGIGKGWIADRLANHLRPHGDGVVDVGGDIAVWGAPEHAFGWTIDLEDPQTQSPMGQVYLSNAAIVTSGILSRRWKQNGVDQHHIIDPQTSRPAQTDVLSTTIIHSSGLLAEAYAKAVILLGSQKGLSWLLQKHAAGMVVHEDGTIYATPNFNQYLIGVLQ